MTALSASSLQLLKHLPALCNMVRRVAVEAGDHTLQYYDEGDIQLDLKADGSPVTIADREAEEIIIKGLYGILPELPFVGEESVAAGKIPDLSDADYFWLVDPVDGTRGFNSGEYTVNIALIYQGAPVLGVIYAPVIGELYAGCGEGTAVRWKRDSDQEKKIHVRDMPAEGLTVFASRWHGVRPKMDAFLSEFKVAKVMHKGSSIKICMVAAGKADLYPRFGQTSEWDTAAGDAILRAAGGHIVDMNGLPLTYGHADKKFLNPEFVASSGFWPLTPDA
jgi:3'(2'), 5'-bisphosphate nucleotidase